MKITVKQIPSEYYVSDWYMFSDRSWIKPVRYHFSLPVWIAL